MEVLQRTPPPAADAVTLYPIKWIWKGEEDAAVCLTAEDAGKWLLNLKALQVGLAQRAALLRYYAPVAEPGRGE